MSILNNLILDSITEGVTAIDMDHRIISFNRAAENFTGLSRGDVLGRYCWEILQPSSNKCATDCPLKQTTETYSPVKNRVVATTNAAGKKVHLSIYDVVLKDNHGQVIGVVKISRDLSLVEELRKELNGRYTFADIISKNHHMQQIFQILPDIAESDSSVLIEGPTGSGKELLARAIHNLSRRRDHPLVAVNCAALPDSLLESELFGYEAGAFTDARRSKAGRFTRANGGTILLDEIGDISPALQVKLLRVLQEKEYEPLGSITTVKTDVRVLAATNKNVEQLVKQGFFRNDLYYRINVIKLTLPPLANRKEDIPLLINHFINRFNNLRERDVEGISEDALSILMRHNYPGNIRELENIIEHAFVLCKKGLIMTRHLPSHLKSEEEPGRAFNGTCTLSEMENRLICEALVRNNGNKKAAAIELGIDKSTLWRKIKKLKKAGLLGNV